MGSDVLRVFINPAGPLAGFSQGPPLGRAPTRVLGARCCAHAGPRRPGPRGGPFPRGTHNFRRYWAYQTRWETVILGKTKTKTNLHLSFSPSTSWWLRPIWGLSVLTKPSQRETCWVWETVILYIPSPGVEITNTYPWQSIFYMFRNVSSSFFFFRIFFIYVLDGGHK